MEGKQYRPDGLCDDQLRLGPLWRDRPDRPRRGRQPDRVRRRDGWRGHGDATADRHLLRGKEPPAHQAGDALRRQGRGHRRTGGDRADLGLYPAVLRPVRHHGRRSAHPVDFSASDRVAWLYVLQHGIAHHFLLYADRPHRHGDLHRLLPERPHVYPSAGAWGVGLWHGRHVGGLCRGADPDARLRLSVCVSAVWEGQFPVPAEGHGNGNRGDGRHADPGNRGRPVESRQEQPVGASVYEENGRQSGAVCRGNRSDHPRKEQAGKEACPG